MCAVYLCVEPCHQGDSIFTARAAPSKEFKEINPALPLLTLAHPSVPQPELGGQVALG